MSYCRKGNWNENLENLINKQINMELFASHSYKSLYSYFKSDSVGFPGIAEFFKKSSDEEMEHAEKFIQYQNIRGGKVRITAIDSPNFDFNENGDTSLLFQAIRYALELEQQVYESILNISKSCDDVGLEDFLDEFVKEQLEGQYELGIKLKQLERIGKDGHGLIHYDTEMFK